MGATFNPVNDDETKAVPAKSEANAPPARKKLGATFQVRERTPSPTQKPVSKPAPRQAPSMLSK